MRISPTLPSSLENPLLPPKSKPPSPWIWSLTLSALVQVGVELDLDVGLLCIVLVLGLSLGIGFPYTVFGILPSRILSHPRDGGQQGFAPPFCSVDGQWALLPRPSTTHKTHDFYPGSACKMKNPYVLHVWSPWTWTMYTGSWDSYFLRLRYSSFLLLSPSLTFYDVQSLMSEFLSGFWWRVVVCWFVSVLQWLEPKAPNDGTSTSSSIKLCCFPDLLILHLILCVTNL
jgi:hypothetical protein